MEGRYNLAHEAVLTVLATIIEGTISLGKETMKGLILINSGGSAALLAFIGHLAISGLKDSAKGFALPLCLFMVAAIIALAGMGLSYISQIFASLACQNLLVKEIQRAYIKIIFNVIFMVLAVLVNIASFGFCGYAVWSAYFAFMSL